MREGEKYRKTFLKIFERQNMLNQTIFELYTDNNKLKHSSNPKDILKSAKKIMKNSTQRELPQLVLMNLLAKVLTEIKYLINTLIGVGLKYL